MPARSTHGACLCARVRARMCVCVCVCGCVRAASGTCAVRASCSPGFRIAARRRGTHTGPSAPAVAHPRSAGSRPNAGRRSTPCCNAAHHVATQQHCVGTSIADHRCGSTIGAYRKRPLICILGNARGNRGHCVAIGRNLLQRVAMYIVPCCKRVELRRVSGADDCLRQSRALLHGALSAALLHPST